MKPLAKQYLDAISGPMAASDKETILLVHKTFRSQFHQIDNYDHFPVIYTFLFFTDNSVVAERTDIDGGSSVLGLDPATQYPEQDVMNYIIKYYDELKALNEATTPPV